MYRKDRESPRGAWSILLCLAVMLVLPIASARADVTQRGTAARATYASESTRALTVGVPADAQAGDVLVASLGYGISGARSQPTLEAPAGWTLAERTDQGTIGALAIYTHTLAAGETSFTWTADVAVGGTAFVTAYGGVDQADPVDASAGRTAPKGASIATPSVTTSAPGAAVVASYFGYISKGTPTSWTPPSGMTELGDAANTSGSRSGSVDAVVQSSAGSTGTKTAKTTPNQDYGIANLTALRASQGVQSSAPPVITAVQAGAVTSTAATITWTTDQRADTQVEYGRTSSYGSSTALSSPGVTAHSQTLSGLAAATTYHFRVRSSSAAGQEAVSGDFTFTTSADSAGGASGPVPVIVDTDMFSDADDAGALATLFGLQVKGEARVIAMGVSTRSSRPNLPANSWKCVAAIAAFYNSSAVPLGTVMPNTGTSVNDPDFTGPCARMMPSGTPAPDNVVNVYRRALAAQPDGSVVMTSIGFFGNLSALLNSAPDSISPLSGRELIARKVKVLVSMAGGFPSSFGETNLSGDPAASQNVAANWPTKVVWSGYEIGDAVHTGQTISRTHPSTSPVRVAYEAFVGAGNWIYSYDLTAVYHAVRPDDNLLRENGPGTNNVASTGDNTWRSASGNQYYLTLSSATQLDAAIEALLDTLPSSAPADTTAPRVSGVTAGDLTAGGATISWSTDEAATTQVEYGTTTSYGSSTTLDATRGTSHTQQLTGLAAGTLYHYRVKSRDAAGNLATSADLTFTTGASADKTPPVISGVAVNGSTVSWTTDEAATTQVEYGTTTTYGSATTPDATRSTAHSQTLTGLSPGTLYHYRVKSADAAGNVATSADATFTTAAAPPGPSDTFDGNTLDPGAWKIAANGSTVSAVNQELEIAHPAGAWTRSVISSTPYDQTGKAVRVQLKRAADDGQGGSNYGETAVFLRQDSTRYAYFFVGGGALTAWVNKGSGETNLTPSWPRYSATTMQWLRFREAAGTLYFEYASGTDAPFTWTTLASTPAPFALTSVTFELAAGSNLATSDIAKFDNVGTA
jgi:hypothetical protein